MSPSPACRLRLCLLVAVLAACRAQIVPAGDAELRKGPASSGVLGQGTAWETPWYVVEGSKPGPTVVLTAGIHGNEPAGSHAANQIRHWPIRQGRLIVVPSANRLGLDADMRWMPALRNDKSLRDLNRNFPTGERQKPRSPLAEALWRFVGEQQPEFVVDLHEGFDFHISNSKSVGSSIIFSATAERTKLASRMLDQVNRTVTDEKRRFELLSKSGAVKGSLVRACTDSLGIDSFILETTFKDQPVSFRARQHRTMVSTLLQDIGMIDGNYVDVLVPHDSDRHIHVALYDSAGASGNGLKNLTRTLAKAEDISVVRVGPPDIRAGVLSQFEVVLFPGGSGGKQGRAIGESGRESVRDFVRGGGGVVGVCAGAYLCSAHYDWSLHVINTAVFNKTIEIPDVGRKSMWYRGGPKDVQMELTEAAVDILGRSGDVTVRYQNGPIISPGDAKDLPPFTPLAWFRSEVVRYEPQRGTMINTPAIISAPFGEGRVLSVSPHPEASPGLEPLIVQGVRWAARRVVASTDSP